MRPTTIDCPHCESTHEFSLRDNDVRHLRQCPDCEGWFVFSETATDGRLEALDDRTTCPVAGCERTTDADALPRHIIAEHDATLGPDSGAGE